MKTLYIIRGLPGSGKSTLAKKLCPERHFEADQYFVDEQGFYSFKPQFIENAHQQCLSMAFDSMKSGEDTAVSNTFTQRWEYEPYLRMAKELGYDVQVIECHGPWRNTHGVPDAKIGLMKNRWQPHI